jgi:hypothetical protein
VVTVYRLQWQTELAIKRLKLHTPIIALLDDDLSRNFLNSSPSGAALTRGQQFVQG